MFGIVDPETGRDHHAFDFFATGGLATVDRK
jgi:hypothetical protein